MENKFKIGDEVKLNPNKNKYSHGQGGVKQGEVGKITSVRGEVYGVDFPSHHYWTGEDDDCIRIDLVETISDLQFADILTLRNRERYVVADNCMRAEDRRHRHEDDTISTWYNDDLTQNEGDKEEDIVKVERAGQIIYERQEAVEMTIAEISEKLGYEIKLVKEK